MTTELKRFWIWRARTAARPLCVCAARDSRHALKIARQSFRLDRTAYARMEAAQ